MTQYLNYFYDGTTGRYLGSAPALPDPLSGDPLIMDCSTPVAPPNVTAANKCAAFWDSSKKVPLVYTDGTWKTVDDFVGTNYWLNGEKFTITEIGKKVPSGASLTEPEPVYTLEEQFVRAGAAVDLMLNQLAKSWDYSNYTSCRGYKNDPDPQFAAEGHAMVEFSSACFVVLRNLKKAALEGEEIPTTQEALFALLPPTPERPVINED